MTDKEKFEEEALAEFIEMTGIPKEKINRYSKVRSIELKTLGETYEYEFKTSGMGVELCGCSLPVLYFPNKPHDISEPFLSHGKFSWLIYVHFGGEKFEITKYAIEAVEAIKEPILNKIRSEIIDTGAYEQEIHGKTEFLEGINYCLSVIDKYISGKEQKDEQE